MLIKFFHNIKCQWKHLINVPRLILSSVVMIESEKSLKNVSICELGSYNYKFTEFYMSLTLHECKINSSISKKLYRIVLWRYIPWLSMPERVVIQQKDPHWFYVCSYDDIFRLQLDVINNVIITEIQLLC